MMGAMVFNENNFLLLIYPSADPDCPLNSPHELSAISRWMGLIASEIVLGVA
jgi:hypothetical protein